MKIKGLLFGLFACAALAACTNDDIVENNGKGEQEKVKGNLTLVIAASNNSSRAAEDGDETDGGTTAESKLIACLLFWLQLIAREHLTVTKLLNLLLEQHCKRQQSVVMSLM